MSFSHQKLLKPQIKKQDFLEYKVLPCYKVWAQMNKKCKSSSWVAAFECYGPTVLHNVPALNYDFVLQGRGFCTDYSLPVSSIPLKGPFLYLIMQQWQYKNRRLLTRYKFKRNQISKFRPANPSLPPQTILGLSHSFLPLLKQAATLIFLCL